MLASAHGHIETVTVLLAHRDSRGVNAQNKVRKTHQKDVETQSSEIKIFTGHYLHVSHRMVGQR